jgi:hypothetical protein
MKLCQSAPPLNRNNLRQATLRPFTPRYSSLSARLRLTRHMPFRLNQKTFFIRFSNKSSFLEMLCIVNYVVCYGY